MTRRSRHGSSSFDGCTRTGTGSPSRTGWQPTGNPVPSLSAIYRAVVRAGLLVPHGLRKKCVIYKRWERGRPMEIWQCTGLQLGGADRTSLGDLSARVRASFSRQA